MRTSPGLFITVILCALAVKSIGQDSPAVRYQVAIFTPLYLDSAFDQNSAYRYGKGFPKYINAGLEFYEGAELAIDSLNTEGVGLDVFIYDSRSSTSGVNEIIKSPQFDSIDLVIGQVNASEAKRLANAVAKRNIPFINANYPNDAGVTNNPNYVVLNSTLLTHCTGIYRFIQKKYPLASVVVFRKKGEQEDRLQSYFESISKNTSSVPLKIKYVVLDELFSPDDLKQYLTEDGTTACIAGSLDVAFGQLLTSSLSSLYSNYPTVLFGMPTWWDVTDFSKPEFKGVEVFYTTPFYHSDSNDVVEKIVSDYKSRFYSRPTDAFFLGFETVYHFAHLLMVNGKNLGSSLSDKRYRVFTEFDIQPVINPKTNTLDYFENKKLYFVKKVNGAEIAVY